MITLLLAQKIVEAARESDTVTEEELDTAAFKLVVYLLIALVVFFLVMVFTSPQFCFRHDIQEFIKTVKNLVF
jgi:hypothetical protein